ncbi:MAG: ATP-binding protein [Myxococcota bacterium]|nr:ATP-binding protein [Myxococcota bacterium]
MSAALPNANVDQAPPRKVSFSFSGRITAGFIAVLVLMAATATGAIYLHLPPWLTFVLILLVGLPVGVLLLGWLTNPLTQTLEGVRSVIASFGDKDFSVRLCTERTDELGDIARHTNRVSQILQDERQEIRQRELLLTTALDHSPAAIMLVDHRDWVVYGNVEARYLLLGGKNIAGHRFSELREKCPIEMRDMLAAQTDGIFTIVRDETHENYHLAQSSFELNRRKHTLILLHRITAELNRQEAEAWKKVIRVVCHELNNSFAPILSLVNSAELLLSRPEPSARIEEIFDIIQERINHLTGFIQGYAQFAQLPRPHKEPVSLDSLISCMTEFPNVKLPRHLPSTRVSVDQAQMQQLLINLVRNAKEASDTEGEVKIEVHQLPNAGTIFKILDRGCGMDEDTIKKALLPFYSTKKTGTGLGLPLCREIIEAHGGYIHLQSRDGGGTTVTCWIP